MDRTDDKEGILLGVQKPFILYGKMGPACLGEEDVPASDRFWHPMDLHFGKSLESNYLQSCMVPRVGKDCAVYVLSCVPVPLIFSTLLMKASMSIPQTLLSLILMLIPPVLVFLSSHQENWYWKRRDRLVAVIHLAMGVGMAQWTLEPVFEEGSSGSGIALEMLLKSPVAGALFCALCLGLRFRYQVVIQSMVLVMSAVWSIMFCSRCQAASMPESLVFHRVGKLIDHLHPLSMVLKLPEQTMSCLGTSLFFSIVGGFLLPLALVYYWEIQLRGKFLGTRVGKNELPSLEEFQRKGVEFLCWVILTAIQLVWIVFRGL